MSGVRVPGGLVQRAKKNTNTDALRVGGDDRVMNNLSAKILYAGASLLLMLVIAAEAAAQKDVLLVLDNSGSMRKNDPQFLARGAVEAFINKLSANSRAGIIIFDQKVTLAVPLTVIDDESRGVLIESLNDINYRGQLTDSPAAVERAIYELKTGARDGVEKFIVFITDGIVDTGNAAADVEKTKWLRDELAVDAADNGIKVYAIAFTEHADLFLIQSLAKKTNGEYFRALVPADLAGVFDTIYELLNTPAVVAAPPVPVAPPVEPAAPIVAEPPTVVTPLQEETVEAEALTPAADPADVLATLTPDEREALADISVQTGIPIEQLALELVGPETAVAEGTVTVEPGTAIVTYPEDELTVEEERTGFIILAVAALVLFLLVIFMVWFVMRRRKVPVPAEAGAPAAGADQEPAMPEAFINDINGYTDEPAIRLGEKPLMVGRVAGTDTQHLDYLVVNKGTVGRRHSIIKYKDYSFWIVDQGSVNGTFVNGIRLSGEQQLKHGDRVRFHKYEFEFSQPEMDDGFHTVFADPDLSEATIVADAATLAATSAMELQARADEQGDFDIGGESSAAAADDADDLFDADDDDAGPVESGESASAAFADASAFAEGDVFDITGETEMPKDENEAAEITDEGATAVFEAPPEVAAPSPPAVDEDFEEDPDEDDEDLGVEINLDTVGADDHPSLLHQVGDPQPAEDFDAEASAFFEDITVGPTPDDEQGPAPDGGDDDIFDMTSDDGGQSALDAKLEQATAILDGAAVHGRPDEADDFSDMETVAKGNLPQPDDPNDLTLEEFIETDSFDAPVTIPPAMPKDAQNDDAGDVTLEAFMSTSMFEGGKVELTNEDATVLPDAVPDDPKSAGDVNVGDTVIIDPSKGEKKDGDDEEDGGSEDPTVVK